jgi:hypothetical protein
MLQRGEKIFRKFEPPAMLGVGVCAPQSSGVAHAKKGEDHSIVARQFVFSGKTGHALVPPPLAIS